MARAFSAIWKQASATARGGRQASDGAAPAAAADADEETAAQPRLTLGRYVVERELGRGAMGAVLLGRDPKDSRKVALKTLGLGREFADEERAEARQRFFREAETAARLRHPGIVTVLDSGEDQGLAWIAMEYLSGHDLQRHTQVGALLPVPVVLRIASRVSDALAYAHRQGVVHRDVKPANVMVDLAADSIKVTDFGIARIADASRTRTGMVLGTPSYMSPEQMAGRRIDGRSDLYSLGVMLFQLLCGQLPHRADSMAALMSQIVNQRAPDIRGLRSGLPAALADLVALALEKRAELRHVDGSQLALDLQLIASRMADAPEPAPPPDTRGGADRFASTVKFSRNEPGHNSGE